MDLQRASIKRLLWIYVRRHFGKYLRVFHPYLFAIYPVASAITRNITEINFNETIRPLLFFLGFGILLFVLLSKLIKPIDRAGVVSSLSLLFLFQYGFYFRFPETIRFIGLPISRHVIITIIWAIVIFLIGNHWLWNHIRPRHITRYMNIVSIVSFLLVFRVVIIYSYPYLKDPLTKLHPVFPNIQQTSNGESTSDLYYIILDGYGRQDVLSEIYKYDNSSFIDSLAKRGFYVADQSRSNYIQTALSISSSLNLEYLDFLGAEGSQSGNRLPLYELIQNNRLVRFLKDQGYTIFSIDSGYPYTTQIGADQILSRGSYHLTQFESMLYDTSAFRIPFSLFNWRTSLSGYEQHRERILFSFNTLGKIATEKGPKFIFAHILAPHPPFVFNSDGSPITPDIPYLMFDGSLYPGGSAEYVRLYDDETTYINNLVLNSIDIILANSTHDPIIVIQGDHGPGAYLDWGSVEKSCQKERTSILNAFYLPNTNHPMYPTITPVNTFRIILDSYFGTSLRMLNDKVYFSLWATPYDFYDASESSLLSCNN
jgi:hypothetical protein